MKLALSVLAGLYELLRRERRCRAHVEANGTYPPACQSCGRTIK